MLESKYLKKGGVRQQKAIEIIVLYFSWLYTRNTIHVAMVVVASFVRQLLDQAGCEVCSPFDMTIKDK